MPTKFQPSALLVALILATLNIMLMFSVTYCQVPSPDIGSFTPGAITRVGIFATTAAGLDSVAADSSAGSPHRVVFFVHMTANRCFNFTRVYTRTTRKAALKSISALLCASLRFSPSASLTCSSVQYDRDTLHTHSSYTRRSSRHA